MSKHYTKAIDNRLAAIEGLVAAIRRMIREDRDCEDILNQLSAAQGSIGKVSKIILRDHLNHCVKDSIASGDDDILLRFNQVLDKYL